MKTLSTSIFFLSSIIFSQSELGKEPFFLDEAENLAQKAFSILKKEKENEIKNLISEKINFLRALKITFISELKNLNFQKSSLKKEKEKLLQKVVNKIKDNPKQAQDLTSFLKIKKKRKRKLLLYPIFFCSALIGLALVLKNKVISNNKPELRGKTPQVQKDFKDCATNPEPLEVFTADCQTEIQTSESLVQTQLKLFQEEEAQTEDKDFQASEAQTEDKDFQASEAQTETIRLQDSKVQTETKRLQDSKVQTEVKVFQEAEGQTEAEAQTETEAGVLAKSPQPQEAERQKFNFNFETLNGGRQGLGLALGSRNQTQKCDSKSFQEQHTDQLLERQSHHQSSSL